MANALTDLIGQIESGGGATSSNVYQEGPAFEAQFGTGEAGVENFEQQAVINNPNISVGDLYAEYNAGTGNPGSGPTYDTLASLNPPAYNNLNNNLAMAGLSSDTPAASLLGQGATTSFLDDPSTQQDFSGSGAAVATDPYSFFDNPGGDAIGGGTDTSAAATPMGSPTGATSAGSGSPTWFSNLFADIENWFQRGALVIIGIVLVAAAAFALSRSNTMRAI